MMDRWIDRLEDAYIYLVMVPIMVGVLALFVVAYLLVIVSGVGALLRWAAP